MEIGGIQNIRARVESLMYRQEYDLKNMLVQKELQKRFDMYMEILDSHKLKAILAACSQWVIEDRRLPEGTIPSLRELSRFVLDAPASVTKEITEKLQNTNPTAFQLLQDFPTFKKVIEAVNIEGPEEEVNIESLYEDIRFGMDFLAEEVSRCDENDPFTIILGKFVEQEASEVLKLTVRMGDYRLLTDAALEFMQDQGWDVENSTPDEIPSIMIKIAQKFHRDEAHPDSESTNLPEKKKRLGHRNAAKARARTVVDD